MGISLHNQASASDAFNTYLEEIKTDIARKDNDYILSVNVAEWRNYILNKYGLEPVTVYTDHSKVEFVGKGTAERHDDFERRYQAETFIFKLVVPYTGWAYPFHLQPSTRTLDHPTVEILPDSSKTDTGFLETRFVLYNQNEQEFAAKRDQLLRSLTVNTRNINQDLTKFKHQVGGIFDSAYETRRAKVLSERSFFEKINISIDKSTDGIFAVPSPERRVVPEPIVDKKTERRYAAEPTVQDKFYDDVLVNIYKFFKSVEKKPSIYLPKDEEALRDYVLPLLELRYDNTTATGETFNKGGKTDILLRHTDGTNLFVAECKYWKGEGVFHESVNQLFDRYLTWRDSKVALIFFVKNKEFSGVLATIKVSAKKHPYFVRENGERGESSFSYVFHLPNDKSKFVYTEIMAFHFVK